ncbi:MAG: YiaA/YiaB family inner membrane protein [Patescibacteria group bacterium]
MQTKGFFSMSYFLAIFATFTLAKVIRDRSECEIQNQNNQ